MYSGSDIPNIYQCSSCNTKILKKEWKLLNCRHRICNVCIVHQRTGSGIKCVTCDSVTDDELFEFLNITKSEKCINIDCCQEADNMCNICFKVYCKLCSVGHRQTNNEHQLCANLFKLLEKYETVHCYDCINTPAEVFCIQCSRTYCAFCQLVHHTEHEYKSLQKLNEENRNAFISVKNDIAVNSVNINSSMMFMESHISKLENDHKTNKAEIDKRWEMVMKAIIHFKNQTDNEFQKLYEKKVSEVKKNRSNINKLKIKNDYYSNFTKSILHHKNSAVDYKLFKIVIDKLQRLKTRINNVVPKLISKKIPDLSMTNFIKSSNEIINIISSVNNVAPPSIIVDLTNTDDEDKSSHETVEKITLKIETLTNKITYTCDVCKRLFSRKCYIRRHMLTHTGVTSYQCDVCKIKFLQKAALKIHTITHTKNKPFKCNICKKLFSYKCLLKKHKFTHTNEKPFKCDVCKKSFSRNFKLKTHMITHTDKEPYNCEVCKKLFLRKRNLYKHTFTSYRQGIVE